MTAAGPKHYRTIFLSDIHLGTKGCKAELLLEFLDRHQCDQLFLVGDIVDGWRLTRNWYWPGTHNQVLQKFLAMARDGTRVVYIPGNHDEIARDYHRLTIGEVVILRDAVFECADGRKFLVIHGDEFDGVVKYAKWLAYLGDAAYNFALTVNNWYNLARRRLGYPYWSLSAYLKLKVKNAVEYIDNFEAALTEEARRRGLDGVICGHIHNAEIRDVGGITYCNDGDWVESCTALVEDEAGQLAILRWAEERVRAPGAAPRLALAS
ncbi:MAG: UDP-2,3-diacylglucosamine diphosphatase [Alphaproteobacteria bacterium]|nr:UDP-2,3-diacylglucosamine diphosphatase [Alphaproteobacteria bacterium]